MNDTDWTMEELAQCAERELRKRRDVYPRWVAAGKMGERTANLEISKMKAIRDHFAYLARQNDLFAARASA